MMERGYWRNREIRHHIAVADGIEEPTLLLKNATYLNVFTKQWLEANIWIHEDRIIYVGEELPQKLNKVEIVDCKNKFLVPGYVEPHAHPFQLYNPEQLALHAGKFGTTTLINDNLMWHFLLPKKKAFTSLDGFNEMPISMYWWGRFDSQTALMDEDKVFNTKDVLKWLNYPGVVQGGELTSWPRLLEGDDRLLYWMQETKRLGKPVEGHFPGASESTLTKMKILGVSADHESMTGEDVLKRLQLGYHVGLRYSSIRPDLSKLITEILEKNIRTFDQFTFTTDGSTPTFYKNGLINVCIDVAIKNGIPVEDAYSMATYHVARHFHLDDDLGSIAPGKIAHINILKSRDNPHPVSVLAKGKWLVKNNQSQAFEKFNWKDNGIEPLLLDWELLEEDLQFSLPIGLELINDVIVKPCAVKLDHTTDQLPVDIENAFLLLIDRYGKWRVNTTIDGFTNTLGGLASSYSPTGDIILIGKSKQDMLLAWRKMKEIGGGIVLAHQGEIIFELPLLLGGMMFDGQMTHLIQKEEKLKKILIDFGYKFNDPIFSIYFLSSTNLPYTRITQKGIYDVMKKESFFPANMRYLIIESYTLENKN